VRFGTTLPDAQESNLGVTIAALWHDQLAVAKCSDGQRSKKTYQRISHEDSAEASMLFTGGTTQEGWEIIKNPWEWLLTVYETVVVRPECMIQ